MPQSCSPPCHAPTRTSAAQAGQSQHEQKIKEESKEEVRNAKETVKVYTDGSTINGKVGAAAVLTRMGRPTRILHHHLGPVTEHNNHEAKLVGILLGLHLVKIERKGNTSFAIGADNQAAIKIITSNLVQPGQNIAMHIV